MEQGDWIASEVVPPLLVLNLNVPIPFFFLRNRWKGEKKKKKKWISNKREFQVKKTKKRKQRKKEKGYFSCFHNSYNRCFDNILSWSDRILKNMNFNTQKKRKKRTKEEMNQTFSTWPSSSFFKLLFSNNFAKFNYSLKVSPKRN